MESCIDYDVDESAVVDIGLVTRQAPAPYPVDRIVHIPDTLDCVICDVVLPCSIQTCPKPGGFAGFQCPQCPKILPQCPKTKLGSDPCLMPVQGISSSGLDLHVQGPS